MKQFTKIGNIKVFTEYLGGKSSEYLAEELLVKLVNGTDVVAQEIYSRKTYKEKAVADLLAKSVDIFEFSFILSHPEILLYGNTGNTYYIPVENMDNNTPADWFCRIDNTNYFKHFHRAYNDFITDKHGKKIVEW